VRRLLQEERFSHELETFYKDCQIESFMMFFYKTTFCPYINQKHEWSDCNYAHRQQDFRRAPQNFYYLPEKCSYVVEDGSWDNCPNDLDCEFSHTLLECIYHPILYKQTQCPDATPDQQRKCLKRDELCTLYHSQQEK